MNICKTNVGCARVKTGGGTIGAIVDQAGGCGSHDAIGSCRSHVIYDIECGSHVIYDSQKAEKEFVEKYVEPLTEAGEKVVDDLITKPLDTILRTPIATIETIAKAGQDTWNEAAVALENAKAAVADLGEIDLMPIDMGDIQTALDNSLGKIFDELSGLPSAIGDELAVAGDNIWRELSVGWENIKNESSVLGDNIYKAIAEEGLEWLKDRLGVKPFDPFGTKALEKDIEEYEKRGAAFDKKRDELEKERLNMLKKMAFFADDELLGMMWGNDYKEKLKESGLEAEAAWLKKEGERIQERVDLLNKIGKLFDEMSVFQIKTDLDMFGMDDFVGTVQFDMWKISNNLYTMGDNAANMFNNNYSWEERKASMMSVVQIAATIAAYTYLGPLGQSVAIGMGTYQAGQMMGVIESNAAGKTIVEVLNQIYNQMLGWDVKELRKKHGEYDNAVMLWEQIFLISVVLIVQQYDTPKAGVPGAVKTLNTITKTYQLTQNVDLIIKYNEEMKKLKDMSKVAETQLYNMWKQTQEMRRAEANYEVSLIVKPAYINFASVINQDIYYFDPERLIPFNPINNVDNLDAVYGFEDVVSFDQLPSSKTKDRYINKIIYG